MIKVEKEKLVLLPVSEIKLNPKNRNKHPEEQVERLVQLIKFQGFRQPLIVSTRSGILIVGHGRLEAAKKIGMTHVPVLMQDFASEEEEYAFGVSDNAIASWAELDLAGINVDIGDLGPDFNVDMLGIENFRIDPITEQIPEIEEPKKQFIVACYMRNEMEMQDLFDDLSSKGIECKLIT